MFETASIGTCKIELLGSLNKLYLVNIKFNIFPATTAFTNLKVKLNTHEIHDFCAIATSIGKLCAISIINPKIVVSAIV